MSRLNCAFCCSHMAETGFLMTWLKYKQCVYFLVLCRKRAGRLAEQTFWQDQSDLGLLWSGLCQSYCSSVSGAPVTPRWRIPVELLLCIVYLHRIWMLNMLIFKSLRYSFLHQWNYSKRKRRIFITYKNKEGISTVLSRFGLISVLRPSTHFRSFRAFSYPNHSIGSVSTWHASGPEFDPHVRHILSWRLGHEKISTVILHLPLIQEEQLSVTGERKCTNYW